MTVTGLIKGVSSPLMALSFQALSAEPPVLMVDTVPGDVLMGGGKFSSLLRHNPSFASVELCVTARVMDGCDRLPAWQGFAVTRTRRTAQ